MRGKITAAGEERGGVAALAAIGTSLLGEGGKRGDFKRAPISWPLQWSQKSCGEKKLPKKKK